MTSDLLDLFEASTSKFVAVVAGLQDMLAFQIHFHRRKGQLLFVDSGAVSSLGVRIFGRPKVQGLLDLDKAGVVHTVETSGNGVEMWKW